MPTTNRWLAQLVLGSKLTGNFNSPFNRANKLLGGLEDKALDVGKAFTRLGLTIGGVALGIKTFEGIGAALQNASSKAWEFDKSMTRIRNSILINQRIGGSGAGGLATPAEREKQFGFIKGSVLDQAKLGANPGLMAATVNAMAQAGMTPKDIATMQGGLTNIMLAKDIHDEEQATELGRSLSRAIMKNQPLHLTRKDIGLATGLPEKQIKEMLAGLSVWQRVLKVNELINLQYKDQAKNIMETDEGVVRQADNWKWLFDYGIGENLKKTQVDFDRLFNWLAPQMYETFDHWTKGFNHWLEGTEKMFHDWWAANGQDAEMYLSTWGHDLEDIGKKFGRVFGKIGNPFEGWTLDKGWTLFKGEISKLLQQLTDMADLLVDLKTWNISKLGADLARMRNEAIAEKKDAADSWFHKPVDGGKDILDLKKNPTWLDRLFGAVPEKSAEASSNINQLGDSADKTKNIFEEMSSWWQSTKSSWSIGPGGGGSSRGISRMIARPHPGAKLTYFGYDGDPYVVRNGKIIDHNTYFGRGAFGNLEYGTSAALTDSEAAYLHAKPRQWITLPDGRRRRYDDRAPESDRRIDLYDRKEGGDSGKIITGEKLSAVNVTVNISGSVHNHREFVDAVTRAVEEGVDRRNRNAYA